MKPLFLLSGIGMIFVAIISVIYWKRKTKISFTFFLLGALAWIIAVILKSIPALALPKDLRNLEAFKNLLPSYLSEPLAWIYIGILTGIFECGMILLFLYVFKRLREQSWNEAVGLGLGFGAFEAFLVGVSAFIITLLAILIPEQLPKELMGPPQLDIPLAIPAPIIERISALFTHIFSTVLVVFSFRTKEWKWFWLSFLYKTLVDSVAGAFHVSYGIENLTVHILYTLEAIFAFMAIVGILGLWMMKKKWRERLEIEQIQISTTSDNNG